jgi:GDSL-like Lipase/Acylhydrolase family/Carbohydrate esterase 2 N-terminal
MKGIGSPATVFISGFFCFIINTCFATSTDSLSGSSLYPVGRYAVNAGGHLELISSAVHFGFQFKSTTCSLYVYLNDPSAHNYLQYTLDGVYQKRVRINGNSRQPMIIRGLPDGLHTVWIYKATEATTGPVFVEKIMARNITALKPSDGPMIEFIGNSITCGAASDPSEIPCGSGEYHDQHNAYYAYGPRVARALNLNFMLSSVSGIGIYRNWNSLSPTMPQVYERTDFQEDNRYWNFKTYRPRVVSIALGTNDFSEGDHIHSRLPFDSAQFVSNYIRFVELVRSKYPEARIALLSSPMLNGNKRELLQRCLKAVKSKVDNNQPSKKTVFLFFFQPMQARGCGGHPNIEDHEILAKELEPFFRNLISPSKY